MTRFQRASIEIGNRLARVCESLASWLEGKATALKRCEGCGENIYWGLPCPDRRTPEDWRIYEARDMARR